MSGRESDGPRFDALREAMSFLRAAVSRRVDSLSRAWPAAASSIFSPKDESSDFEPLLSSQDGIFS